MTSSPPTADEREQRPGSPKVSWAVGHVALMLVFYSGFASASRSGAGLLLGLICGPGLLLSQISTVVFSMVIFVKWMRRDPEDGLNVPGLVAWLVAFMFCCLFTFYIFFVQGRQ